MQTRALESTVPDAQEQVALPATIQYAQFTPPQTTQQHTSKCIYIYLKMIELKHLVEI